MAKNLLEVLLAPVLVLTCLAFQDGSGEAFGQSFTLRQGQAVYITALRRADELYAKPAHNNSKRGNVVRHFYYDHDLGAEKQIRNRIEKWRYFKVVDKASESDFVLLVHVDSSAMEGVALPLATSATRLASKRSLRCLQEFYSYDGRGAAPCLSRVFASNGG